MKKSHYFIAFLLVFSACASSTETLIIGPKPVPCKNETEQDCFQVKKDSLGDWIDFSGNIAGFEYEPGFIYTLEVEKTPNEKDDPQTQRYILKKVIKKEQMPNTEKEISGDFIINSFKGSTVSDKNMTINFNVKTGQVNGKGVCNRFSGTFTTSNTKIKFSQAATTKIMCREPELERDFFHSMNQVDHFSMKNDELKLMKGDETIFMASLKTEE